MISEEIFIKYMEEYKKLLEIEEKINDSVRLLSNDFNGFVLEKHDDLIVKLLKELISDKYDYIDYYIYELDWGLKGKNVIEDENGNKYSLTNLKELYSYIIKNN